MNTNILNNVNVFAKDFVTSIIEGNEKEYNGYDWQISFYMNISNQALSMVTLLIMCDVEGEEVGRITYEVRRNKNARYTYITTFSFDGVNISNVGLDSKNFEKIKDTINSCEEGLYDKMLAYLHRYTMEQMEYGEDEEASCPPIYYDYYSPSRIKCFMEKYGVSSYVPIVVEVVDDKGLPYKYLSLKDIGFNDESNELLISLKED